MAAVAPDWAVAVTIADKDEEAVTAVSAPVEKPVTAAARLDKSVLMPVMAFACVCRVVTSPCQTVNCPLCAVCNSVTTPLTSIPFPFSRFAVLKLIPMSFSSFACSCRHVIAGAQFRRLSDVLSYSALHGQFL